MIAEEAVLALAFIYGVVYNAVIGLRRKYRPNEKNLIAIEVMVGITGVLLLGSILRADRHYILHIFGLSAVLNNGQSAAWIFFRLFAFAGIPMVAGSMYRNLGEIE